MSETREQQLQRLYDQHRLACAETIANLEKQVAELDRANEVNLQRGNLWRDDCARFERQIERLVVERDEARRERDALAWQVEDLKGARDSAGFQAEELKRLGQQFERDSRKFFEQSCKNLERAERAEAALAETRAKALEPIKREAQAAVESRSTRRAETLVMALADMSLDEVHTPEEKPE